MRAKKICFFIFTFFSLALLYWIPPIRQDPSYHNFVGDSPFLQVLNGKNTLSSLVLVPLGAWGAFLAFKLDKGKALWILLFAAVFFSGWGSFYYHLAPSDAGLAVDRFPMAIGFMAFLSVLIGEKMGYKTAYRLAPFFIFWGLFSVLWWFKSGDLRPYAWVQFFPIVALPYLLIVFYKPNQGTLYLVLTWIFYLLAKLCEMNDERVFLASGELISGHTLKHLSAAFGVYFLIPYTKRYA